MQGHHFQHNFESNIKPVQCCCKDRCGVKRQLLALAGCAQFWPPTAFMHVDMVMQWLSGWVLGVLGVLVSFFWATSFNALRKLFGAL